MSNFLNRLSFLKNLKKMNRNAILIGVAAIAIIVVGVLIFAKSNNGFSLTGILGMTDQQIGEKALKYINDNKLSQTPATLVSVSQESGLVKVKIKIGTQEFDSYATKDGKILLPQGYIMEETEKDSSNNNTSSNNEPLQDAASMIKTDSPMLEAFIVSRCPFGLQMQRMMADAVKNIPSLAQYIKVKYMGSVSGDKITSMHDQQPGGAEATENLRQICIREEQPSKYWAYVGCQMKASGTETSCEKSTGVDSAKLSACMSDKNKGIAYAQKDFTVANAYNVTGSPTLAINGAVVAEFDSSNKPIFGGRVSDEIKTIVCAAFNSKPSFCSTKLSTVSAASGFSATYAPANSGNSGNSGANCAPAQ